MISRAARPRRLRPSERNAQSLPFPGEGAHVIAIAPHEQADAVMFDLVETSCGAPARPHDRRPAGQAAAAQAASAVPSPPPTGRPHLFAAFAGRGSYFQRAACWQSVRSVCSTASSPLIEIEVSRDQFGASRGEKFSTRVMVPCASAARANGRSVAVL